MDRIVRLAATAAALILAVYYGLQGIPMWLALIVFAVVAAGFFLGGRRLA